MSRFRDIGPLPDPVVWHGATVLARDSAGRVLMQLRDDRANVVAPGQWCFFGGAVEPGETLETAARREFLEETGIDIADAPLEPLARFASGALVGGVVHVFTLGRPVTADEVTLGEGAGFAFLTRAQVERFDVIANFRRLLLELDEF
ncbi:NUDIX domain-containing protein [Marimonas arenosa]|uniref:NUDIX hydrolase n=1 Tax=Marimonas arenosa TaxID=1795305 RepID=A0AAE3WHJ6_9RHOB|nr:NUDIX hydrolase [Marimonas arenosa]MDQ2091708.1 NUDIX hydrolase [Marimonas arenosa]